MTPDALEPQATSPAEISALLRRFEVAVGDASVVGQSADGRYIHVYTAGYLLAKIVLRAEGVRVKGGENHVDTLRAVPFYLGSRAQSSVDALDAARKRRNSTLYDAAGLIDERDVADLLLRVEGFEALVCDWLRRSHPELLDYR